MSQLPKPRPEPTIEVAGYFGPKHLTLAEFTEEWSSHMAELFSLSFDHYHEFKQMQARVVAIAQTEFFRLLDKQQGENQ